MASVATGADRIVAYMRHGSLLSLAQQQLPPTVASRSVSPAASVTRS